LHPPPRTRWAATATCLALAGLVGCSSPAVTESPEDAGPGLSLPGQREFLPPNAAVGTDWGRVIGHPTSFDADAAYPTPRDVADALGASLAESFPPGPGSPVLELFTLTETDARAIMIINESVAGDAAVAGSQYAIVVVSGTDGWHVTSVWSRTTCIHGVDSNQRDCT
jgi:hypothetical protein